MNFESFCRMMGLDPSKMTEEQRAKLQQIWQHCDTRNVQLDKNAFCRVFKVGPKTVNAEARTVSAAVLTDAATMMYDWDRGWIEEVLPMETCRIPAQMPLCDTHNTHTVKATLGSCRNLRIEKTGDLSALVADLHFAEDQDSKDAFGKVRDGHITDMSGGYRVYSAAYVEEGQTYNLNGRSYRGPMKIALDWEPSEGSICPIGADQFSKVRAKQSEAPATPERAVTEGNPSTQSAASQRNADTNSQEANAMKKTFEEFCRAIGINVATLAETQRSLLELVFQATCKDLDAEAAIPAEAKTRALQVMKSAEEAEKRGQAAELERQSEIRSICYIPGTEALVQPLIDEKKTVEEARKAVIEHIRANNTPISAPRSGIEGGETSLEKTIRAASHGIAMRNNIKVDNPVAGADSFRGRSYLRIAEEILIAKGVNTRNMTNDQIAQRVMADGDFPIILSNAANLMMAAAYELSEETWRDIAEINNDVSDFKVFTVANFGGVPTFSEIQPGGSYKAINFNEMGASNQIKTYGCEATATRQMIINDNLGAFFRALESAAEGSEKLIGTGVWGLITTNGNTATYGDGTSNALFSAKHGNLISDAEALGTEGMKALRLKLRQMKGLAGKDDLNIKLDRIAVPSELEEQARLLCENQMMVIDGVGVKNTSFGTQLTVENRLSAASVSDYYGFGRRKIIQVAFLNGQQRPEIVRLNDRNPDNMSVLARIDVGWAVIEHRYAVKADV